MAQQGGESCTAHLPAFPVLDPIPAFGLCPGLSLNLRLNLSLSLNRRRRRHHHPHPPPDQPISWRDIPLAIKLARVDVTIVDQVATTKVDQVFVNAASYPVEGTYIFPLPEDAAISSFDMSVDRKSLEGKLLGRDEAQHRDL